MPTTALRKNEGLLGPLRDSGPTGYSRPEADLQFTFLIFDMSHRCTFANVLIELPADWVDVGDDMPEDAPPTLARVDGVGVLQFSVARYQSGANPNIHEDDLDALLREFAKKRSLGFPSDVEHGEAASRYIGATFVQGTDLTRVWYASNGSDLALVTYVADAGNSACLAELTEAAEIVRSIDFD